jgi:hypothetical protein
VESGLEATGIGANVMALLGRHIRVVCVAAGLVFLAAAPGHAQLSPLRTVQQRSCPAMDSLLGPLSQSQRHAVVMAHYDKERDGTSMRAGPEVSGRKYLMVLSFDGASAQAAPAPLFGVDFPARTVQDAAGRGTHLLMVLTDSTFVDTLRLDLGAFKAPRSVQGSPERLPAVVLLSPASFLALARASSAAVMLDSVRVAFDEADLAEINVLYRVSRCGVR